jgi:DNA adenine methylase
MRVQVEHSNAIAVIKTYDTKKTFFYLDPPYVLSTRRSGGYEHEMSDADHQQLIKTLLRVKGRVMLSGYRSEIYEPLERHGWQRIDFKVVCHAAARTRFTGLQGKGAATREQSRVESVWLNYEPAS